MSFEKTLNSKFFNFCDIIFKLIIINMLFFFTSFFGLLIFTFYPSLIASFIIIISISHKKEFPLFITFWKIFKKVYFKAQIIFLNLLVIGILIFSSLFYYYHFITDNLFYLIAFSTMLIIAFTYIIMSIHTVFVFIHFPHLRPFQIIKNALILSIGFLFHSIFLIIIYLLCAIIIYFFTFLLLLVPFLILSFIIYLSYTIIGYKYQKISKDNLIDITSYL